MALLDGRGYAMCENERRGLVTMLRLDLGRCGDLWGREVRAIYIAGDLQIRGMDR